jgi:hypothetical protein
MGLARPKQQDDASGGRLVEESAVEVTKPGDSAVSRKKSLRRGFPPRKLLERWLERFMAPA